MLELAVPGPQGALMGLWNPLVCGVSLWEQPPAAAPALVPPMLAPVQIAARSNAAIGKPIKKQKPPPSRVKAVVTATVAPGIDDWLQQLLDTSRAGSFFSACPLHKDMKKSEATHFCVDCCEGPRACCQYCVAAHAGHRTVQCRRYIYCDVIRVLDIAPFVDVTGIQTYTVNAAKVVFLHPRPQSKPPPPGAPAGCRACGRALREGCSFCCLACRAAEPGGGGGGGAAAGGSCGSCGGAAAQQADASAPAGAKRAAGAESGGSGGGGGGGGACAAVVAAAAGAAPEPSSSGCSGQSAAVDAAAAAPAERGARAPVGQRASEGSDQSHLEWQAADGLVCRRKQQAPRRSPYH